MDANTTNPLYTDPSQQVDNPLSFDEQVLTVSDPLALTIPDGDLIDVIDERIKASMTFFNDKYKLGQRRSKNFDFLMGKQASNLEAQGAIKDYETKSSDNALYEIEASLKPLAMSKLPDIIVTPGTENDQEKQKQAEDLSLGINDTNKKREQRDVLGLGFKHLPVYFTAVIKTRWNLDYDKDGDFCYEIINPDYVVVDHTAKSKDPDDMSFIAQCVPMTVQDAMMKFPSKKKELFEAVNRQGIDAGHTPTWKDLASEIKLWEVWFDWFRRKGTKALLNKSDMLLEDMEAVDEPESDWERVCGVLWKFDRLLLDKTLDPNYDHEGEQVMYSYAIPGDETTKTLIKPEDYLLSMLQGMPIPNVQTEQMYHNYFTRPHKPFYFFGYDQWGKVYLDETSRIEQNIRNQENLDDQNRTLLDQIKTRVKHIWSKDSGLKKADIQRLDMDNPKMDVSVEGDPNAVHKAIQPERPDSAQFNALDSTRARMYAISGSTAIRGTIQSDTATSNQIAREADFTRSDDLVEDTINSASEWMANWQLQWIKLRYTKDHLRQILGTKGEVTYLKLRRDMISDGMEVMIKASSTDKLKAQRNAMDAAKLGPPYTNPIDFFKDMDMNDPEGRAERGLLLMIDPMTYYTKYVLGLDTTQQQAGALTQGMAPATPAEGGMPPGQPPAPPMGQPAPMAPPMQNTQPQGATPMNTSAVPTAPPQFPTGSPRAL